MVWGGLMAVWGGLLAVWGGLEVVWGGLVEVWGVLGWFVVFQWTEDICVACLKHVVA